MQTQRKLASKQKDQNSATAQADVVVALAGDGSALNKVTNWRAVLSTPLVILGCAFWFVTLSKLGASMEALPWYITIGAIGVICAQRATRKAFAAPEPTFSLLPVRQKEPLSLLETFAITFLIASVLLYAWTALDAVHPKTANRRLTQFVDIQLVGSKDFADRQSPLAGTQEQPDLHKRQSDQMSRQGSLTASKPPAAAQKSPQRHEPTSEKVETPKEQTRAAKPQPERLPARQVLPMIRTPNGHTPAPIPLQADDMVLIKPAPASAATPLSGKQAMAKGHADGNRPYLEEVQPPELVEMIENEGTTDSTNVFIAGGSSQGGSGAPNALTDYIKALHKRIKGLWSPPRGQSHKAAILFRIRRDGKLAFIKLINSSGDYETDNAAVKAVVGSVNGHPLPASSGPPFLDVQYTFNYTADELKEIPGAR